MFLGGSPVARKSLPPIRTASSSSPATTQNYSGSITRDPYASRGESPRPDPSASNLEWVLDSVLDEPPQSTTEAQSAQYPGFTPSSRRNPPQRQNFATASGQLSDDSGGEEEVIEATEFKNLQLQAMLKRRYQHLALSTLPYCDLKRIIISSRYTNALIFASILGVTLVNMFVNLIFFAIGWYSVLVAPFIIAFAIVGIVSSFALYRPLYMTLMIGLPTLAVFQSFSIVIYIGYIIYYVAMALYDTGFYARLLLTFVILIVFIIFAIIVVALLLFGMVEAIYMWTIVSKAVKQVRRSAKGGSYALEMSSGRAKKMRHEKASRMADFFLMTAANRVFLKEMDATRAITKKTMKLRNIFTILFRTQLAVSAMSIVFSIFLFPVLNVLACAFSIYAVVLAIVGLVGCRRCQPTYIRGYLIGSVVAIFLAAVLGIVVAIVLFFLCYVAYDVYYEQSIMSFILCTFQLCYLLLLTAQMSMYICCFASWRLVEYYDACISVQKTQAAMKADQKVANPRLNRYQESGRRQFT